MVEVKSLARTAVRTGVAGLILLESGLVAALEGVAGTSNKLRNRNIGNYSCNSRENISDDGFEAAYNNRIDGLYH